MLWFSFSLKKRVSVIWVKAYRNTTDSLVDSGSKVQHEVGGIESTNETQGQQKALSRQCNERSDLQIFLIRFHFGSLFFYQFLRR